MPATVHEIVPADVTGEPLIDSRPPVKVSATDVTVPVPLFDTESVPDENDKPVPSVVAWRMVPFEDTMPDAMADTPMVLLLVIVVELPATRDRMPELEIVPLATPRPDPTMTPPSAAVVACVRAIVPVVVIVPPDKPVPATIDDTEPAALSVPPVIEMFAPGRRLLSVPVPLA